MQAVSRAEALSIASLTIAKLKQRATIVPPPPRPDEIKIREALAACSDFPRGFAAFLPYWHFRNRENTEPGGSELTFANLWPGQQDVRDQMVEHPWLFLLKAGKLGFTEIECAWDGYVATFGAPNGRTHLFSKDFDAAKALLEYVKFGLARLPEAFGARILTGERGGDTLRSCRLLIDRPGMGLGRDVRTIYTYATDDETSIDQSCVHAHIDEWCHMKHPKPVWTSVQTTVAPGGSCHIVSRGAGEDEFAQSLWASAEQRTGKLKGFFAPWNMRPDRDDNWIRQQAETQTTAGLAHFAPESPEDAFLGDEENNYLELEWWDACLDPSLPPLAPGDKTPIVLAADAGTVSDYFAITAQSRHPERLNEPAIRAVKVWKPEQFPDKRIHYDEPENWIRLVCQGGCVQGHAQTGGFKRDDCSSCQVGDLMPALNVVELAYDNHQLEDMMQRLRRERVVHAREFPQSNDRYESDRMLRNRVLNRQISHNGDSELRQAIGNAKAKLQQGQDSKMRIDKKAPHRHVDPLVAASMGVYRCMKLNLGP